MRLFPLLLVFGSANLVSGLPALVNETAAIISARTPIAAGLLYQARNDLVTAVNVYMITWKDHWLVNGPIGHGWPAAWVADVTASIDHGIEQAFLSAAELNTILSMVDPGGAKRSVRRAENPAPRDGPFLNGYELLYYAKGCLESAVNNGMTNFQHLLDTGAVNGQFSSTQINDMRNHILNARSFAFYSATELVYLKTVTQSNPLG